MFSYIKGEIVSIEQIDDLTNNLTIANDLFWISCISSIFNEESVGNLTEIYLYSLIDMHSWIIKIYWFKSLEDKRLFLSLKSEVDKIPTKIALILSSFPKETLEWIFNWNIKISGLWPKIVEKVKDYFINKEPKIKNDFLKDSSRLEEIEQLLLNLWGKKDLVKTFLEKTNIKDLSNSDVLKLFFNK